MKYTDPLGKTHELSFYNSAYIFDNSLAVLAYDSDGSPYAHVTVCLGKPIEPLHTLVDVNNCKRLVDALYEEGAFFYTYRYERSGYVEYPEVVWDEEWLKANTKELEQ